MTNYSSDRAGNPGKSKRVFNSARFFTVITVVSALFFLTSCEEKSTEIGMGLLPGSDFINISGTDTITPFAYTKYIDSVRSNHLSFSFLGGLEDSIFGYTSTDFVAQLRLKKEWPRTGYNAIESVELFFGIDGAKGKYNTDISVSFYETGELIFPYVKDARYDTVFYYSDKTPSIVRHLATVKLPKILGDSVKNYKFTLANEVGEYLLRDTTKLFQGLIRSDFRSFFKGIYVTAKSDPTKGDPTDVPLLIALSFANDNFTFRVNYKDRKNNSQVFDFRVNDQSARYNRYTHDFSKAEPVTGIKHINDDYRDTITYLQGINGAFTRIRLSGLEHYKTLGQLNINRARLTVPVLLNKKYTTTTIPTRVFLSYVNSKGEKVAVPDMSVSSSFFDGTFNSSTKKFTFNLAAFVQEYLRGNIAEPELDMYYFNGEYRNVILKTSLSSTPAKFEMVYTKR